MTPSKFNINEIRIASPCPIAWENMKGDNRTRHCDSCNLNVFNISELSTSEAEQLITNREGRLCLRLYRRNDGTVLTKDCPVGLRAVRKRVARRAGAVFAAVLGLVSISFGQKKDGKPIDASKMTVQRTINPGQTSSIAIILIDQQGDVIPGAEVRIKNGQFSRTAASNDAGICIIDNLPAGVFTVSTKVSGFRNHEIKNLKINESETASLKVELVVAQGTVLIGIVGEAEPMIDVTSTSVTKVISIRDWYH